MSFVVDCGYLAKIQAMASRIWSDPMQNIDLIADVESARAVLENQSVSFGEITNTNKKRTLQVEWLAKCDVETQDCGDDCEITGDDVEPVCKDYELECLRETSFKVPLKAYRERTVDMQAAIATNMLKHKKALAEWLTRYILTGIVNNAGVNQFTGGIGNVVGNNTFIAALNWDDQIWGYLNQVIRMNKLRSPYLITGNNLFQLLFNRTMERTNDNGRGNFAKIGSIASIYQDPENVEAVAANTSFLLHKTAAAFVNKAWHDMGAANAVNRAGNYWQWSETLPDLPSVAVDITMKETCEDNEFYQAFALKLWGVFAMNPLPCNEDQTGILQFTCGSSDD